MGDDFELQPKSPEKYKTIIKALAEKHTEFHTYQPKEDKSFWRVHRGMQYSTDTSKIKSEIEKLGHKVVNIFNVKQNWTHILLPLFFVDLKPSKNNIDTYQKETLNYTKVKFKPLRPKRNIPQYSKCQRYGHTQTYCYHSPRSVKCACSHLTKQCLRKERSEHVKCVLRDDNHPANYKGCTIYKDIQKEPTHPYETNRMEKNWKVLLHTKIKPDMSYASTLKSQQHQYETATPQSHQHTTYQQQPQLPTSDIQELKVVMKGLMEQMGTMLSLLTTLVSKMAKITTQLKIMLGNANGLA